MEQPTVEKKSDISTIGSFLILGLTIATLFPLSEGFWTNRSLEEYEELRPELEAILDIDFEINGKNFTIPSGPVLSDAYIYISKYGAAARYQSEKRLNAMLKPSDEEKM
jgi:hypothetical protein